LDLTVIAVHAGRASGSALGLGWPLSSNTSFPTKIMTVSLSWTGRSFVCLFAQDRGMSLECVPLPDGGKPSSVPGKMSARTRRQPLYRMCEWDECAINTFILREIQVVDVRVELSWENVVVTGSCMVRHTGWVFPIRCSRCYRL